MSTKKAVPTTNGRYLTDRLVKVLRSIRECRADCRGRLISHPGSLRPSSMPRASNHPLFFQRLQLRRIDIQERRQGRLGVFT